MFDVADALKKMFEELSQKHLATISEDIKRSEKRQRSETQATLQIWKSTMVESQADMLKTLKSEISAGIAEATAATTFGGNNNGAGKGSSLPDIANPESAGAILDQAVLESAANKVRLTEDIRASYDIQMAALKQAISEERSEANKAQLQFEQVLQTKYDNMVQALREKIAFEHEARMKRSLEELEKTAVAESLRAKQAFELQQVAEAGINSKFKSLVVDLRQSWEQEEVARAKQLEERLRNHYSAVLAHMETQLQLALKLQDDADKQWMEDVEIRNKQQVNTLKAFEAKCRRLYDGRLSDYIAQTNAQLGEYETALLKMGSTVAQEKATNESRLRRMKLACTKWKCDYQKDIHKKYAGIVATLEGKYIQEMEKVLEEMRATQQELEDAQVMVQQKERALLEKESKLGLVSHQLMNKVLVNNVHSHVNTSNLNTTMVKENLNKLWSTLNTTAEEKISVLLSLFDCVQGPVSADDSTPTALSPAFINKYLEIEAKLTARIPISKLLTHKQLLEFKLRNAQAMMSNTNNTSDYEANAQVVGILNQELIDLVQLLNASIRAFEEDYKESYFYSSSSSTATASAASGSGGGQSGGVTINEDRNTTHMIPGKLTISPGGRRPAPTAAAVAGAGGGGSGRHAMSPTATGNYNNNNGSPAAGGGSRLNLSASAPSNSSGNSHRLFNNKQ